jgi:hypothetical protein
MRRRSDLSVKQKGKYFDGLRVYKTPGKIYSTVTNFFAALLASSSSTKSSLLITLIIKAVRSSEKLSIFTKLNGAASHKVATFPDSSA